MCVLYIINFVNNNVSFCGNCHAMVSKYCKYRSFLFSHFVIHWLSRYPCSNCIDFDLLMSKQKGRGASLDVCGTWSKTPIGEIRQISLKFLQWPLLLKLVRFLTWDTSCFVYNNLYKLQLSVASISLQIELTLTHVCIIILHDFACHVLQN